MKRFAELSGVDQMMGLIRHKPRGSSRSNRNASAPAKRLRLLQSFFDTVRRTRGSADRHVRSASEVKTRRELEGPRSARSKEPAGRAYRRIEISLHRLGRLTVLRGLKRPNRDITARVVRIARSTNVGLVEDVEGLAHQADPGSLIEPEDFLQPEIERAERAREIHACRHVLQCTASEARKWSRASRQSVPAVDHRIQLAAVLDFPANRITWQEGQPCSARAVDVACAGQEGVCRHARAERVDGRQRQSPRQLSLTVEREAMALIGHRVAFFEVKVIDALDQINLLVNVVVGQLIVVRVVERLRERVADVVLIAEMSDSRWAMFGADNQAVIPRFPL